MPSPFTRSTPKKLASDWWEHPTSVRILAPDGGAGEPAKLGNELAHRALLPEVAVSRHMGGEIALQPGFVVPMGAGRVARAPLLPVGIGRLRVDELMVEPDPAHASVRVEPAVGLNEPLELALRVFQQPRRRPVNGEPGPDRNRRRRGRVDDPRLIVDVIDPKLDAVLDSPGRDDRHARPVAAVPAAGEDVTHGEDGLERVPLRASGRRDVRLPRRDPNRIVEDRFDGLGVDPAGVVPDDDRVALDDDFDLGRDLGFLAGVERVVDQLLGDHQRPFVDGVPGLILELALAAKFHQARDLEGDAGQLRLGLAGCRSLAPCLNWYKARCSGRLFSRLKTRLT